MEELFLNYDNILFVACNDRSKLIEKIISMGVQVKAYDYDPKFSNTDHYETRDFVFDGISKDFDLVVNWNCEKTFPLGQIYQGNMILIGDNDQHNGDCNPISSFEMLIKQNRICTVYDQFMVDNHYVVHGSNIS